MTGSHTLCPRALADLQSQKGMGYSAPLSWVGMEQIDLPVEIAGKPLAAKVSAGINLVQSGETEKGIHMSRLYLQLDALTQDELTPSLLKEVLTRFRLSHQGQCDTASIAISGDLLLSRKSLNSNLTGWKAYPITVSAELQSDFCLSLQAGIPYSSTCPGSAALSRQVAQLQFQNDFADRLSRLSVEEVANWLGTSGMPATPHSQRSWAWVTITLSPEQATLPVVQLIDHCETVLGTAVQTAVKRSDEQAFAVANGQNLMFCEDAARRLHQQLIDNDFCDAFDIRIEHQESLHAHNAVAKISWRK